MRKPEDPKSWEYLFLVNVVFAYIYSCCAKLQQQSRTRPWLLSLADYACTTVPDGVNLQPLFSLHVCNWCPLHSSRC